MAAVRLRRARERRQLGLTLVEGPILFDEAVAAGVEFQTVFSTDSPQPAPGNPEWVQVSAEVLEKLADTVTPQGPVAVMRIPNAHVVQKDHVVVDVADPGNAGTLIRTAAAFGLDVVFGPKAVDPWSPKVLRAGAGAHFRTSIGLENPDSGTIATVVDGGIPPRHLAARLDPQRSWAVLVGSEAHGLDEPTVRSADVTVTIPMPGGTESLNAAVAGAIVAYELSLWRAGGGAPQPTR